MSMIYHNLTIMPLVVDQSGVPSSCRGCPLLSYLEDGNPTPCVCTMMSNHQSSTLSEQEEEQVLCLRIVQKEIGFPKQSAETFLKTECKNDPNDLVWRGCRSDFSFCISLTNEGATKMLPFCRTMKHTYLHHRVQSWVHFSASFSAD